MIGFGRGHPHHIRHGSESVIFFLAQIQNNGGVVWHDGAALGSLSSDLCAIANGSERKPRILQPGFGSLYILSYHVRYGGVGPRQLCGVIVRFHTQDGQNLTHNLARRRRHHIAAGGECPRGTAGGIHSNQHDILRIIRRGETHEGHHDITLGVGVGPGAGLIGRAGLASDPVARYLTVSPGA